MAKKKTVKETTDKNNSGEQIRFSFSDPETDSALVIAELLEEEKKEEEMQEQEKKKAEEKQEDKEDKKEEKKSAKKKASKEKPKVKAANSRKKKAEDKAADKEKEADKKNEKEAAAEKKKSEEASADKTEAAEDKKKTKAKTEKKKTGAKSEKKAEKKKEEKPAEKKKPAASKKTKAEAPEKAEKKTTASPAVQTKAWEPEKEAAEAEKKTEEKAEAAAASDSTVSGTGERITGRVKRHIEQAEALLREKKESKERAVIVMAAASVLLVFIIFAVWGVYKSMYTTCYVASTSKDAALYYINEEENGALAEADRVVRGSEIKVYRETLETEEGTFRRAEPAAKEEAVEEAEETADTEAQETADGEAEETADAEAAETEAEEGKTEDKKLYIKEENIAETADDVVRETEVFVRTPATVYAEEEGPAIASFVKKGSCLEVKGYDRLEEDGTIHKYKIACTDPDGNALEGYVYGKYMTDSQESADAVYNENGVHDKAKEDVYGFNLYGGKAENLDYYPYEKPVIEGNEFCSDARTMYLNCAAVVHPKNYVKIINDTDCNAVVCDIKDGVLAYESDVAKEMSPNSYKTAYVSKEEYKAGVDKLRETGAYLIGRIVVFNDPIYAKDHPENCIKYEGSTSWPSAYSRGVWEYNVRLAQEAIREFGFNEIQFDYVRFPESSYEMSKSGDAKFRNKYDEEKGQAVQNFCFYAADQIHEAGAYFSIDVFGESAYGYMTAYGQYWPGLTNIVDAISAMPYTDHTGGEGAWTDPGGTVKRWAKRAKKMQDYIENPAAARTWITGYDTPYWAPTENYGPAELKAQAKALKKQGLTGGFIPWNSGSSVAKYRQYKDVWNAEE